MPASTLIEQLVELVEYDRMRGTNVVSLSAESRAFMKQMMQGLQPSATPVVPAVAPSAPTTPSAPVAPATPASQSAQPASAKEWHPPKPAAPAPSKQPAAPEKAPEAASWTPPEQTPTATPNVVEQPDTSHAAESALKHLVSQCQDTVIYHDSQQALFGEGNPQADLMFIGEGPGGDEDENGRPFRGKAWQLLSKMIAAMQFSTQEVYIVNILKSGSPRSANATEYLPHLKQQIEQVKPKCIVTLGATPLRDLLQVSGVASNRGKWLDYEGIPAMPTYHPSYLLRLERSKRDAWADLQQVMKRFGKDPAKTRRPRRRS